MKSALYAHAPKIAKDTFQRLKRLVGADVHVHVNRVVLRHIARYMKAKEYIAGRDVLDVACGSGYGALILSNAASYRGIDLDPRALNEARREYPEFHFAQGSICELPLPNESASAITSFETLEHISQPELAMAEIARVLTLGGVFIGSIPINHPDRIHHFKPYSAREAYGIFTSANLSCTGVFVQMDLEFTETKESDLSGIASGTLIGVMLKNSS